MLHKIGLVILLNILLAGMVFGINGMDSEPQPKDSDQALALKFNIVKYSCLVAVTCSPGCYATMSGSIRYCYPGWGFCFWEGNCVTTDSVDTACVRDCPEGPIRD